MQAFKRYCTFIKSYKELRQRGRQARRDLPNRELALAAEAAHRNDSGQLHRIIRRLAPKQKRDTVRIHGPNGEMLREAEEHGTIVQYFQQLFQSTAEPCTYPCPSVYTLNVSTQDVFEALDGTKYGKAVPPRSAPSSAVKICADLLAQAVTPQVNACLSGVATPPLWADCHLALIPKPKKPARRPENLRPLGLQDCGAKAYAKLLKQLLLREVSAQLVSLPVFAYLPHRGTDDAIARVAEHCRWVRERHQQNISNVHTHRLRQPKSQAYGGLQLAIDLSTAFDLVPRAEMYNALCWAGASPGLVASIMDLHSVCRYTVTHKSRASHLHMRRGVRQGCTLAPLLWVVYSAYMTYQLQKRLPAQWVADHLTLYADDTHASFKIECLNDVRFAFRAICTIFEVYKLYGMKVNPSKSGIVLGVRGRHAKDFIQQHIQGPTDKPCLVIGIGAAALRIPIKQSMTYLGIEISYANFEQETLVSRLRVAQATRCRLSKVLSARRYLTQSQRVHLYILCVRSAALYGLGAVGLQQSGVRKLLQFETRHLRAIVRSPVHLTKESTAHLYQRLRLSMPAQQILSILQRKLKTLANKPQLHKEWIQTRVGRLLELLQLQRAGLREVSTVQELACPTCGQYFSTLKDLRMHHTRVHKQRLQYSAQGPAANLHALRTQDHSVDGMPVCRHCKARLTNWHAFRVHILTSCPILHTSVASSSSLEPAWQYAAGPSLTADLGSALQLAARSVDPSKVATPLPVAERPSVLAILATANWKNMLWFDGVAEHLRNYCIFCAQWLSSAPGALNKRLISIHPELFRCSADAVAQSLTLNSASLPCALSNLPAQTDTSEGPLWSVLLLLSTRPP